MQAYKKINLKCLYALYGYSILCKLRLHNH